MNSFFSLIFPPRFPSTDKSLFKAGPQISAGVRTNVLSPSVSSKAFSGEPSRSLASGNDLKELEEAGLLLLHGDVLLELDETCLVQVSESGDLLELGGTGLMQSFTGDLLELGGTGLMQSFTGDLLELGGTGLMQSFTGDLLELGGTGLMQSFTGDLLELVTTAMLQLSEDGDWLELGLLQLSANGDLMDVEDSGW